jgi:hypothetical protein
MCFGAFAFQAAVKTHVSSGPAWAARQITPVARVNVQQPTSVPVATGKGPVCDNLDYAGIEANTGVSATLADLRWSKGLVGEVSWGILPHGHYR